MATYPVSPDATAQPTDTGPVDSLDDELRAIKTGQELRVPEVTNLTGRGPLPVVATRANKLLMCDPATGAPVTTGWTHADLLSTINTLLTLYRNA